MTERVLPQVWPGPRSARIANALALRTLRIGPIFPDVEPDRSVGMRGQTRRKTKPPIGAAYRRHRQVRRRIAAASRRKA